MKKLILLFLPLYLIASEISVQILGSGGPELDERASSAYLVKVDGKARVLIDCGGGSMEQFAKSKAKLEDLNLILLTHLHIDHVVDLPALMKAGYFSDRSRELKLFGPQGNQFFPDINAFLQLQFGEHGAYRYMSDILTDESDSFTLVSSVLKDQENIVLGDIHIRSASVNHGIVPALAYRIEIDGKSIVFSSDTTANGNGVIELAKDADLLVAHHAIPEHGYQGARRLHMHPSKIAEVASKAKVKKLVLSHRMKRTYGHESESEQIIRQQFNAPIIWAEDLMEISLD